MQLNEMELLRGQRSASILPTREDRRHQAVAQAIVNEAREVALKGDASAALASRGMERSVDLYKYGQSLAGDDPILAGLMNRFVGNFADGALRRQREFDSGFKL